jgi:hypothetical protein
MKGGIVARFASWCGNMVIGLVVVGAILVAVVGPSSTASLYTTGAQVAGTSTGITFAALPALFSSVRDGQALVKKEDAAPKKKAPSTDKKG